MPFVPGKMKTKYETVRINEIGRNVGDILEVMARYVVFGEGVLKSGENHVFNEINRISEENLRKIKDPYFQTWVDGSAADEIGQEDLNEPQQKRFETLRDHINETLRQKELAREKAATTPPAEPSRRAEAAVGVTPGVIRQRAGAISLHDAPDEQVVQKNAAIKKLLESRLEKVRGESKSTIRDDRLVALLAISDFILKNDVYVKNREVIDFNHVEDQLRRQYKSAGKLDLLSKFNNGISPSSANPLASAVGRPSEYAKIKEKAVKIKDETLAPEPKSHAGVKPKPE